MNHQAQSRERHLTPEQAALLADADRFTETTARAYEVARKAWETFCAARDEAQKASEEEWKARKRFSQVVMPEMKVPPDSIHF